MSSGNPGRVWIFDLDDTLHNASRHVFPHINHAMTRYLMVHLGLDEAAANQLRRHYWEKYGATLHGLMRHHGTDPHHFLQHTHQFADLSLMVLQVQGLREMLARLGGRKVVFTNAPMAYARQVLDLLRIRHCFEHVFSIESTRFQPKPAKAGFMRLLSRIEVPAARCVMVEDSLPALKMARQLGMKTVFINPGARRPSYVDARLHSVLALPNLSALL
jgi:putative hydrolase of the HAD superfamily